jgi:hypothetical protein
MTTATRTGLDAASEVPARDPKMFVEPDVWEREIKLLVRDHSFDVVTAERLFGQAVAYLITAMEVHGRLEIGCSASVDAAVHTFILDTRNYRQFCHRHFDGKFLDHVPELEPEEDGSVRRSGEVIEANGFQVDWPLWEQGSGKCKAGVECKGVRWSGVIV